MKMMQIIKGAINFKNTIIQQDKVYENTKLLDDYFKEIFSEIDELFEQESYELIQEKLDTIYAKKQDRLSDYAEKNILKYNCLLALVNDNEGKLNLYLKQLSQYGQSEEYLQVEYNICIFKKDNELFEQLKCKWIQAELETSLIQEKEVKFLFLTSQYDEIIKRYNNENFIDKDLFIFFIGKAFIQLENFEEGQKVLHDIKDKDDEYKLTYVLSKTIPILMKPRYIGECNKEEREIIQECYKELESIDDSKFSRRLMKIFTYYKLQVTLLKDKKESLELVSDIYRDFNDDLDLSILKVDILFINNKLDDANEICDYAMQQFDNYLNHINTIINVKLALEKWNEIIKIFNLHKEELEYNECCFYAYGLAIVNIYGYEVGERIIEKDKKTEGAITNILLAKVYINDNQKCQRYLDKAITMVNNEKLLLIDISIIYESIGEITKSISVLEDYMYLDIRMFKRYIAIVLKYKTETKYNKIIEIHRKYYFNINNEYIDSNVYGLCIEKTMYRLAYYISHKMFESKGNLFWRNQYVRMKLHNKEWNQLKELTSVLEFSEDASYLITAAEVNAKFGQLERAEELVYKAIYKLDRVDIESAIRIGNLMLANKSNKDINDTVDDEVARKVIVDDVIILQNEYGEKLCICLNNEIYFRGNEVRFGCLHINQSDDLWLDILGCKKNDIIEYNGTKFSIFEIVNKYDYVARLCFEERLSNNVEGIKQIAIEEKNGTLQLENLKLQMRESNIQQEKLIDSYMNEKLEGIIPINIIAGEITRLEQLIEFLLVNKEYRFRTGISKLSENKCKVVLTTISIIVLNKYGILDDFIKYFDVYVSQSMIITFEDLIQNLISKLGQMESYLHLIDEQVILNEISEKDKKDRIKKYKNIHRLLLTCNIISKDISKSEFITFPEHAIYLPDIEALEIAKSLQATIFVDDIFTMKLFSFEVGDNISNISGFLNSVLFEDFEKYWGILKSLIKGKYEYTFNYEALARLIFNFDIYSPHRVKKFKKIVKMILRNDINGFYKDNLKTLCKRARKMGILRTKIDIILEEISLDEDIEH